MNNFSEKAAELFLQGYSCSEAVVKAADEAGITNENIDFDLLNRLISPFSGAMGAHECLCGAVAGSQMLLGLFFGRISPDKDQHQIKDIAAEFNKKFREQTKVTCCKAIRAQFKGNGLTQRESCANIVKNSAEIVQAMINERLNFSVS